VRVAAGLEGVRLHDLRHTVASYAAGQGHSLYGIGNLLGHKDQRSTARYAHFTDDARKALADSVGSHIASKLRSGPARQAPEAQQERLRILR
jgi:integrase